jgi:hypothetical protein
MWEKNALGTDVILCPCVSYESLVPTSVFACKRTYSDAFLRLVLLSILTFYEESSSV